MNCPGHAHLFGLQQWSYRDLPRALLRARPAAPQRAVAARCTACCACGTSPRTTRTSSAPRSRSRTRSTACLDFAFETYALFGIESQLELSTRPENRLGDDELWDHAEGALAQRARGRSGLAYTVNEGDGAFYGPKIDLHMTDSLGRSWQLGTVQLDYSAARALRPHLHRRRQRRAPRR